MLIKCLSFAAPTLTDQYPFDAQKRKTGMLPTLVTKMGGEIIPIDGKTIRGSYDRNQGKSALHIISAWSTEQRERVGTDESRR